MTTFLAPLPVLVTAFVARVLLLVRAVPAAVCLLTRAVLPPPDPGRSRPGGARATALWVASVITSVATRVALRLVAPPACAACDAPAPGDAAFCAACVATVEPTTEPDPRSPFVDVACGPSAGAPLAHIASGSPGSPLEPVACGVYGGALAEAVRRLKYRGRPDLARPLGALLAATVTSTGLRADLVMPVPLHPRKLRERGYNQSALLAGPVARAAGARLEARGLVRKRHTAAQASLSKRDRRDNIAGAFRVRATRAVQGKQILLVDDVATTGATLRACAAALLDAGAASVTAIVIARAPEHGGSSSPR